MASEKWNDFVLEVGRSDGIGRVLWSSTGTVDVTLTRARESLKAKRTTDRGGLYRLRARHVDPWVIVPEEEDEK